MSKILSDERRKIDERRRKNSVVIFVLNRAIEWNSWFIKFSYSITSSKVWDVMWLCGDNEKYSILFYFNHITLFCKYSLVSSRFFICQSICMCDWVCVKEFYFFEFLFVVIILSISFWISVEISVYLVTVCRLFRDCMEFYFVE